MGIVCFLAGTAGRVIRVLIGVVLIWLGWSGHSFVGYVIAIIGLVPLAAGVFDFCVVAKIMGLPFSGKGVRAHCAAQGR